MSILRQQTGSTENIRQCEQDFGIIVQSKGLFVLRRLVLRSELAPSTVELTSQDRSLNSSYGE